MRWDDDVSCIFCGGDEVKRHSRRGGGIFYYRCKFCGKNFTDATGTMFHRLRIPLTTVFRFAYLLHSGTPVNRLHKTLGIAKTAAFRLAKKLRNSAWFDDLASMLNKEVTTDPRLT